MIMRNVTGKVLRIGMVLWLAGSLGACTELDEGRVNGNSQLQVRLTDAHGDFDAVFIDVSGVLIHRSATDVAGAEDGGWERIDGVKSGVYNLLELVNGHDTLLVDANVPSGHFARLRLVLGESNRVEAGGKSYPLQLAKGVPAEVDLNIDSELRNETLFELLLDFDVARSIAKTDSTYQLKPVLRVLKGNPSGGIVRGVVTPAAKHVAVMAITGNDTLGTYTDTLGNYLLKAVPSGN